MLKREDAAARVGADDRPVEVPHRQTRSEEAEAKPHVHRHKTHVSTYQLLKQAKQTKAEQAKAKQAEKLNPKTAKLE